MDKERSNEQSSAASSSDTLPREVVKLLKEKGLWPLPEAFRLIGEEKPAEKSIYESIDKISKGLNEKQKKLIDSIKKQYDE